MRRRRITVVSGGVVYVFEAESELRTVDTDRAGKVLRLQIDGQTLSGALDAIESGTYSLVGSFVVGSMADA